MPSASSSSSSSATSTSTSSTAEPTPLPFYPAYCNPSSPTWNTWVKLTAHDIHHVLRPHHRYSYSRSGFDSQSSGQVLFYLNHPVQHVQVVGVVVAFDEHNDRLWLFTVDDGSGETIEVTCAKLAKVQPSGADPNNTSEAKKTPDDQDEDELNRLAAISQLDIGTVVQAKGSIRTFHNVRQLNLIRLKLIPNTASEILLIEARTKFLETVLSQPWSLDPSTQRALLDDAQGNVDDERKRKEKAREKEKSRAEREMRHARQIAKDYEREERKRAEAGEEAKQHGLRLQRSTVKQRSSTFGNEAVPPLDMNLSH